MKAVILCAGLGKRLKPYTDKYQKTMLPLHGKPVLEYILEGLIYADLKEIIFVVGYRKEQIINYFQDGVKWGAKIEYVEQKKLNGTGGALLLCENLINDDHFFLTWGDILIPYRIYKEVQKVYQNEKQDFVIVANYSEDTSQGAAIVCEQRYLQKIIEKPKLGTIDSKWNNAGIFILSHAIFNVLKNLKTSIRGEIELPDALSQGLTLKRWKVRVLKMKKNQFRGDLGNINVYETLKTNKNWIRKLYNN